MNSAFLLSLEKYISSVSIAAFFFYLAYVLPEAQLGELSAIESLAVIFSVLTLTSFDAQVQNRAIRSPERSQDYIFGGLYLKLLFSLVAYAVYSLVAIVFLDFSTIPVLLVGSLIVWKSFSILQAELIVKEQFMRYVLLGLLVTLLSLVIKVCVVLFVAPPYNAVVFAMDALMVSAVYSAYLIFLTKERRGLKCVKSAMPVLKESLPFLLSSFILIAYSKIDQLFIAKMLTFVDVANYSLAMKLVGAVVLVSNAFILAYVPAITKAKALDSVVYAYQVRRLMFHTLVIGTLASIVCFFVSPFLVSAIYADKYEGASFLARLASPLILLMFLATSVGRILIVENLGRFALTRNILALAVNVFLNFLLIPWLEVTGAIIASLVSWFISSVLMVFWSKKTRFIFKVLLG